jgi:hypothetical protein
VGDGTGLCESAECRPAAHEALCRTAPEPFALTECGLKNLTDPTWWTRVLKPQIDKYPLSYFLVWRNAKHEYFGPAPGEENAIYFNEMVSNKNVLTLKDIIR